MERNAVRIMAALSVLWVCGGCRSLIRALNDEPASHRSAAAKKVRKKQSDGISRRDPLPPSGLSDHLSAAEQAAIAAQKREGVVPRSEFKTNEENDRRTSAWVFGR